MSGRATLGRTVLLLGALCCLGGKASGPKTATIAVDMLAFGPAPTGLRVGDTVEWVNRDIFLHSATDAAGGFDVRLPPGGRGRVVLKRPGTIDYYCRFHPGMKGRLVVAR